MTKNEKRNKKKEAIRNKKNKINLLNKKENYRVIKKIEKEEKLLEKRKKQFEGENLNKQYTSNKLPSPNEQCYCGSGLKFKKCHMKILYSEFIKNREILYKN